MQCTWCDVVIDFCVENGEPLIVLGTGKALRQFVYSQVRNYSVFNEWLHTDIVIGLGKTNFMDIKELWRNWSYYFIRCVTIILPQTF